MTPFRFRFHLEYVIKKVITGTVIRLIMDSSDDQLVGASIEYSLDGKVQMSGLSKIILDLNMFQFI